MHIKTVKIDRQIIINFNQQNALISIKKKYLDIPKIKKKEVYTFG